MPVLRYFLSVGAALLALLFAVDSLAPQEFAVASHSAPGIDKSTVRIHSNQKWPERVVYDTSQPIIVPPALNVQAAVEPATVPVVALRLPARVRDTFAQFVPSAPGKLEPQAQGKRGVANARTIPSSDSSMRFAQQSHFGLFGGPDGNSTW